MRKHGNIVSVLVTVITLTAAVLSVAADKNNQKLMEIPVCSKSFGTIAVALPGDGQSWWTNQDLQLPPPSTLMKLFVMKSGCFDLVDHTIGIIGEERMRAAGGELQLGSNVGLGQKIAADYVMVPELAGQNPNLNGVFQIKEDSTVSGAIVNEAVKQGSSAIIDKLPIPFLPKGKIGLDINKKTADVILSVADLRSARMIAMTEGHSEKKNVSFGVEIFRDGDRSLNVGGYANTEMGKVITMAYIDAYTRMINDFLSHPEIFSKSSNIQSVKITKITTLLSDPQGTKTIRNLEVDMLLHPTGNKDGLMWEVVDDYGYSGWVSVEDFQWAK